MPLSVPVILIIFNRPDLTKIVFDAIAQVRPTKLLVVADGPRFPEEAEKCKEARSVIRYVDWDCEVLTDFAESNLGCRRRVVSGLNWAFSQVEEAIILEDDCLPEPSFFRYCEELLALFREDSRIMEIAGENLAPRPHLNTSYLFSRLFPCWGWATWRRAWQLYDDEMKQWPEYKRTADLKYFGRHRRNVYHDFEGYYLNRESWRVNSWAARWAFSCTVRQALSVIPRTRLIKNLGFGSDATNTTTGRPEIVSIPVQGLEFPLRGPHEMKPDPAFDQEFLDILYGKPENIWKARIRGRTRWLWQYVRHRLHALL